MAEESPVPSAAPMTAGRLLRQAREAQGLHIAALAASLKVPQRKLEALERDHLEELPDATFARALAQTVCRALKIDAAPVLALLPRHDTASLDQVSSGLNTPFRERPGAAEPALGGLLRHPATGVVGLLVVAALVVWLWPRGATTVPSLPAAASAAASAVSELVPMPSLAASEPAGETVHAAPAPAAPASPAASAPSGTAAATGPGLLTLRTREASWVEVTDGGNRPLLSRTVQPGESVGLDGALPLRLTVGNASATEISFRGQPVDLSPQTRDNIARLELK